ncbi:unnamed protein product [Closterium sp. Yama58-4]|nr:unnamed protein product [Closterium sp. Yama58-4]
MALVDRTTDSPLLELLLSLKNASTTATAATAATPATPRVAATPFLHPLLPPSSNDRACSVEKASSATAAAAASASSGATETGGAAYSCVDAIAPRLPDDHLCGLLRAAASDESPPAAVAGPPTGDPLQQGRPMALPKLAPRISARDASQSSPAGSLNQQQQSAAVAAAALIAGAVLAANAAAGRRERAPISSSNVAGRANCGQNEIPSRKSLRKQPEAPESQVPELPEAGGNASLRKQLLLHAQRGNSWEPMPSVIPGPVTTGGRLSSPSFGVASLARLSSSTDVATSSLSAFLGEPRITAATERSCYSESLAMALRAANEVARINIGGVRDMISGGDLLDSLGFEQQERSSRSKRCLQCGRIFLSGQALGGHMRKHWKGPKRPEHSSRHAKDSLSVTKSAAAQDSKHSRKSPSPCQLNLTRRFSEESMELEKEVDAQEIDLDLRL